MKSNPKVSAAMLAEIVGISKRKVEENVAKLKKKGWWHSRVLGGVSHHYHLLTPEDFADLKSFLWIVASIFLLIIAFTDWYGLCYVFLFFMGLYALYDMHKKRKERKMKRENDSADDVQEDK